MDHGKDSQSPISAAAIGAALTDAYRVRSDGDEWLVEDPDGCALAWVKQEPLAVETVLSVFWTQGCEDDEEALEERMDEALAIINGEFRAHWEANGFVVPEYGELSQHEVDGVAHDYYRVWVRKPVSGLGEAVDVIRWVAEQERDAGLSIEDWRLKRKTD